MFNMSEIWGWRQDGSNPCRHVKRYKEHQRERFLSEEEVARRGKVLRDAEDEMPSAVTAFRLLLLTGCRSSEIRDLQWEHAREDCIELPDTKNGGRVVPLEPEARAVLSAIPREDNNPWVIAGELLAHDALTEGLQQIVEHPRCHLPQAEIRGRLCSHSSL